MTALVVIVVAAGTYLVLRGIRDWGRARAARRESSSWIGQHQRDRRARQLRDVARTQRVRP